MAGICGSKNVAPLLAVATTFMDLGRGCCWRQLLTPGGLMDMQRILQIIQKCWGGLWRAHLPHQVAIIWRLCVSCCGIYSCIWEFCGKKAITFCCKNSIKIITINITIYSSFGNIPLIIEACNVSWSYLMGPV